jgi:hypothetical protein
LKPLKHPLIGEELANKKYVEWDRLRCALVRNKIESPGKVATILLEAFVGQNGKLRVSMCREKGLCLNGGEFYEWRRMLKEKDWLAYDTDDEGKLIRYFPGRRLVPYVNREKAKFEIATTHDLLALEVKANEKFVSKEEYQQLEKRIKQAEKAISNLIETLDPPSGPEKVLKFLEGSYTIPTMH